MSCSAWQHHCKCLKNVAFSVIFRLRSNYTCVTNIHGNRSTCGKQWLYNRLSVEANVRGKRHLLIFACHSLCFKQVFILLKPSQSIRHIISYCQVFHPLFSFYAELNMQMRLSIYCGCSSSFYRLD